MRDLPAIIVPAFERPESLRRLLASISVARYSADPVTLLISLEGGVSPHVREIARSFQFQGGSVEVVEHPEKMGLRQHILWCGDQTDRFGDVIVLEDDLVVDPLFYSYAVSASRFYRQHADVAGIALYSPRFNEFAELPFEPLDTGAAAYFMQTPCSWGQLWTRRQWQGFRDWYDKNSPELVDSDYRLPSVVRAWGKSSWKKSFAGYLVAKQRFFVYPYRAYSTNCADAGGHHIARGTSRFQVPFRSPRRLDDALNFSSFEDRELHYDAFMEPCLRGMNWRLPIAVEDMTFDIYGIKSAKLLANQKYCMTSLHVPEAMVKFPLRFRPVELNLSFPCQVTDPGGLFLCSGERLAESSRRDRVRQQVAVARYYLSAAIGSRKLPRVLLGDAMGFIRRITGSAD